MHKNESETDETDESSTDEHRNSITWYSERCSSESSLSSVSNVSSADVEDPRPNQINYPASSAAVLLPLTIANNFTPEVLMCGGTTANTDGNPANIDAQRTTAR